MLWCFVHRMELIQWMIESVSWSPSSLLYFTFSLIVWTKRKSKWMNWVEWINVHNITCLLSIPWINVWLCRSVPVSSVKLIDVIIIITMKNNKNIFIMIIMIMWSEHVWIDVLVCFCIIFNWKGKLRNEK